MNRKGKNFFLMLQLFLSFIALFLFMGLNLKKFNNYFEPLGYSYDNVWVLDLTFDGAGDEQKKVLMEKVAAKLKTIPGIQLVSRGRTIPFYRWGEKTEITVGKQVSKAMMFDVDDNYKDVLDLKMVAGRWFSPQDNAAGRAPVVITKDLAEREFGSRNVLGRIIKIGGEEMSVVGVSETFKENTSAENTPGFFKRLDTGNVVPRFVLKFNQGLEYLKIEDKIRREVFSIPAATGILANEPLVWKKKYAHKLDYIQLSIAFIVFAFLVINVFLGVSGVFTYNLSKRKAEVGLRVAMGASPSHILQQFLGETMVLTTFGILPGLLIAVQLLITRYFEPHMNLYYGSLSIVFSALFLYLLMIGCALYPSLKASVVQPADALHED